MLVGVVGVDGLCSGSNRFEVKRLALCTPPRKLIDADAEAKVGRELGVVEDADDFTVEGKTGGCIDLEEVDVPGAGIHVQLSSQRMVCGGAELGRQRGLGDIFVEIHIESGHVLSNHEVDLNIDYGLASATVKSLFGFCSHHIWHGV